MDEPTLTQLRMARMIAEEVERRDMTQAEFARRVGATTKHINTVFTGKSGAYPATLDFWAFVLGMHWEVTLAPGRHA